MGKQIPVIQEYISEGIVRLKAFADGVQDDKKADWKALNDMFFECLSMD